MSIIAIMIPIAIQIGDPASALILLSGVYYGAIFGGSTSSILINAPGVAGTVASSFDGYPMARAGSWKSTDHGSDLLIRRRHHWCNPPHDLRASLIDGSKTILVRGYFALMVLGLTAIARLLEKEKYQGPFYDRLWGHAGDRGRVSTTQRRPLHYGHHGPPEWYLFRNSGYGSLRPPRGFVLSSRRETKQAMANNNKIENLRISREEARRSHPSLRVSLYSGSLSGFIGAGATMASFLGYGIERNLAPAGEREKFGRARFVDWRLRNSK